MGWRQEVDRASSPPEILSHLLLQVHSLASNPKKFHLCSLVLRLRKWPIPRDFFPGGCIKQTDLCLISWLLRNGGSSIPGRTIKPSPGITVSTRLWGRQDGGDSHLPTVSRLTWVREPDGSWGAEPSFYQKRPSPRCLPFLEILPLAFAIPLLRICYFGGHFNHCCPRPHHRGHGVPHRQAPPTGTGTQSLSEQVNHSPAGDRGSLAGQFPLKTSLKSFCLLIQMFMEDIILGPRTFSGSPLLTGF